MMSYESKERIHHERGFALGEVLTPKGIPGFAAFGHIDCKGLPNTRDLGGMPAADGRHIREGGSFARGRFTMPPTETCAFLRMPTAWSAW